MAALAVRAEQHSGAGGRAPLVVQERPDRVTLSLAQQRMWFLNRFDQQSAADNMPFAIRLSGDLDIEALRAIANGLTLNLDTLEAAEASAAALQGALKTAQVTAEFDTRTDKHILRISLANLVTGTQRIGFQQAVAVRQQGLAITGGEIQPA